MAEELSQISVTEFENVWTLLLSSTSIQAAFVVLLSGMIGIATGYRKFSRWVTSQKFYYTRPHVSKFLRQAALPFFAITLITSFNVYMQFTLGSAEIVHVAAEETLSKILNTFNVLVIGYTVAHLIPIILNKIEKTKLEELDFDIWFEMRGFSDDTDDFFHKLYKWTPPRTAPVEIGAERFTELLKTPEGISYLEAFRTSKGVSIGSYEKIQKDAFEVWKQSERDKFAKYYNDCTSGDNQSGRKLKPNTIPREIFSIDVWREEKRINGYDYVVPGARPSGYMARKKKDAPMSLQRVLPLVIFAAVGLGVAASWGIDLFVLATATGGFSIGLGLALQETMQNYFAYMAIRKDKIVVEGDRIKLESGYNGNVHKITPRVTYIMDALYESIAIIPTRQLVASQVVNYTKEHHVVPASVTVGVSYLNNPRQVASILHKVGKRAMREIVDDKGRHMIRQHRCPNLDENKASCGCDRDVHESLSQPLVRFTNFGDSALDFTVMVYVRNYGAQFKTKTEMRVMIYEEFERYDIRIPWPIRTIYNSNEAQEREEIAKRNEAREKLMEKYSVFDIIRGDEGTEG
ncbi:MAG: mechanosensitive ion channel [Cenarchaeum sp. SB0662_bin_33]|nr:mechanosensitive ion channel [Cenarchaeum sp. SB0662_bin_33]